MELERCCVAFFFFDGNHTKTELIRTPVFGAEQDSKKLSVSIAAPKRRKINRDLLTFGNDSKTLHIIKKELKC